MTNSAVQTSLSDRRQNDTTNLLENRQQRGNRFPVWEEVITFTIEADGGSAELTYTSEVNGLLTEMIIEVGTAAVITGTVSVDFDTTRDVEFDTNDGLGEGSETLVELNSGAGKPLNGFKIRVDPSDDPTGAGEVWEIVVTCIGT